MQAQDQGLKDFEAKLNSYKRLIDEDIDQFCAQFIESVQKIYGQEQVEVARVFADILKRGGKRSRGILTIIGYEMCGGQDKKMIIQAARAIEMMHAYILIIDDIQDRSDLRRGKPSAHNMLKATHEKNNWKLDESGRIGEALAMNAALLGAHYAEIILANLDVDPELRLKAVTIMNHTMMVTTHGQTQDIVNSVKPSSEVNNMSDVMQWKTAHYSVLNPIHMGMVLAGAGCEDTNAITEYALNVGKAFQIANDLTVMEDSEASGKTPIDDIREGKQTILTIYAAEHAKSEDAKFLEKCLGNPNLSKKDFTRCQRILDDCGAADYAKTDLEQYINQGREALEHHKDRWDKTYLDFLNYFSDHISSSVVRIDKTH